MTTPQGMQDKGACETPMRDHVERFWKYLETETVRILVDMRRDTSSVPYWDSSSFSDAVAKALVADRRQAAAPNQGREAIIEECAKVAEADNGVTECPYMTDKRGDPTWGHTDQDECPICGQTGKDDGSKCHGLARQRIAERIRALTPAVAPDAGRDSLAVAWLHGHCRARGFTFEETDIDGARGSFLWNQGLREADRMIALARQAQEPVFDPNIDAGQIETCAPPPQVDSGREDVTLPLEFIRNCGCPSDHFGTVGECTDKGTCGCSIGLALRPERSGGRE